MDRNIQAFLAVARCQTLTDASVFLNLTQPSVTKRIAKLEESLNAALFVRSRRGMTLTAAGEVFLERAKRIEEEYRFGTEEVATIAAAGMSVLRVGAGPVFHLNCVASLFAQLKAKYPALKLELHTDHSQEAAHMLLEGDLDIYLGSTSKYLVNGSIFNKYFITIEHGIVLRADDPLANRSFIEPSDVANYQWISFVVDPDTEASIKKAIDPSGEKVVEIDVRSSSFATGVQLVKGGNTFMTAPLQLAETVEKDNLVILPTRPVKMPRRQAGVHVRKSSLGFNAIQSVIEYFEHSDFVAKYAAL